MIISAHLFPKCDISVHFRQHSVASSSKGRKQRHMVQKSLFLVYEGDMLMHDKRVK